MANRTYGPPRHRAKHPVGAPPPAKWWGKHARHRFDVRIPVRDIADDWLAIAGHYALTSAYRAPRWLWRHRDHDVAPVAALSLLFPVLLGLAALLPWPPVPRWLEVAVAGSLALAAAGAVAVPDTRAGTSRTRRSMQRTLDQKINGLTVQAVQDRPHATTVVCTVAPGLDPDAYDAQKSTLAASFRSPLHIVKDTPGRLELRIEHQDLLAHPADWQAIDGDQLVPDRLPAGHDWDGKPFTFALAHQSLLVAGIRGGGKSAFLNGLVARLAALPHVELYLIDPLEGVDLGVWWSLAQEVANSEESGAKLLGYFEDLRADRVRKMVTDDRPVQIAKWGQRWPMRVLVIDELASLTLWGDRKQREHTANLLHSIAAKGRKSNDVLVAATQHPSADVIPTLVRGQFTNVLGLRVGRREQTRQVFGDGMVGDWDLSSIPADQPGRGIWSNGSTMTPVRTAGLWGTRLRRTALDLGNSRSERLEVPTESLGTVDTDPRLASSTEKLEKLENADTAERIRQALPTAGEGVSVVWLVEQTGLPQSTIYHHLQSRPWVEKVKRGRYRRRP